MKTVGDLFTNGIFAKNNLQIKIPTSDGLHNELYTFFGVLLRNKNRETVNDGVGSTNKYQKLILILYLIDCLNVLVDRILMII